jgi:phosphoserine phosphatase
MSGGQTGAWTNWDPRWRGTWEALLSRTPTSGEPWVAAFDADGTLWADDAGEAMLRVLAEDGDLQERTPEDVLAEYASRVAADASAGYAWAVTVMAGLSEQRVQRAAQRTMDTFLPTRTFSSMTSLLAQFQAHPRWEVVIVSASNRWVVEAGVAGLGIGADQVLGLCVPVADGVLGEEPHQPLTNGKGKVEALFARFGRSPALAMGNSMHDAPMLEAATELSVAVNPSPELYDHGLSKGWGMCALEGGTSRHD